MQPAEPQMQAAQQEVAKPRHGVVVIGRNEGERLRGCLVSLDPRRVPVVYVDSGSTDGSVELAERHGAHVARLDISIPFTAARARNEGFRRLLAVDPTLAYVQFVDGDCEIVQGWLEAASGFLDGRPEVVAACGRRKELFPETSVYNLLCDIDWDCPVGENRYFGGDVMLRTAALKAAGGYKDELIAGEEPELCVRLRQAGWRIWRLDHGMTLHDANILHFRQWWRRSVRTGYAYAEGAALHGRPPERHWVRETRSACFWGAALPLAAVLALPEGRWLAAAVLALYPLQVWRLYAGSSLDRRRARLQAVFLLLGKFPQAYGVAKYALSRLRGARPAIIEYK